MKRIKIIFLCISLALFCCCEKNLPTSPDIDPIINPPAQLMASCSASVTEGEVPLTVNFIGSVTGGVAPYDYYWDFGDGGISDLQDPSYTYLEVGDYLAIFTVVDGKEKKADASIDIKVLISLYEIQFVVGVWCRSAGLSPEADFDLYVAEYNAYIGDCSQFEKVESIYVYNPTSSQPGRAVWRQELSAGHWTVLIRLVNGYDEDAFKVRWTAILELTIDHAENATVEPLWQQHEYVYMSRRGRTMSLGFWINKK